jgi:hypothetical protein
MKLAKWSSIASSGTMVAVILFSSMAMFAKTSADSRPEERFERSFSVEQGSTLVVNNRKGTVHIKGSDSDQIVVNVYKRFSGPGEAKTAWLKETEVNFTADAKHPKIEVVYPDPACQDDACDDGRDLSDVELTIQVPRQINLELTGRKPDMFISSIEGNIRIESRKSPILIESTTGAVYIVTHKNDVRLKDVTIQSKLDLITEKGTAEIEARSLGEETNLETTKGSIVLHLPSNSGAVVDFTGGSRSVLSSDFPLGQEQTVGRAVREIHATINQGGTRMRLRTDKGSFILRKASSSMI